MIAAYRHWNHWIREASTANVLGFQRRESVGYYIFSSAISNSLDCGNIYRGEKIPNARLLMRVRDRYGWKKVKVL